MISQVIIQLIGTIIGAAIGSLIGAVFVRLATHWVCKFTPAYGMAYVATFYSYLTCNIIGIFVGLMIGTTGNLFNPITIILLMVIGFFIGAAIYGIMIKHPESGPIGFGKACLVNLVLLLIGAVIFGIIGLIVFVAMR